MQIVTKAYLFYSINHTALRIVFAEYEAFTPINALRRQQVVKTSKRLIRNEISLTK